MVTYVKGDLFKSPAKVLVNTVNTVGIMGKGIAKTFKDVFPEMFQRYQHICENKMLTIGTLWLYKTEHKWILNFPTKLHWKNSSKPEYIEAGLRKFVATYAQHGITSIAFPQLGCGNGELDWNRTVRPLMEQYLGSLAINIFIYIYDARFPVEHRATDEMKRWLHSEPQSLAFETFWEDMAQLVGTGMVLQAASGQQFHVSLTSGSRNLLIKMRNQGFIDSLVERLAGFLNGHRPRLLDQSRVIIPRECMLDLWQTIRSYGFCTARMMPAGLDVLAPYLLPLLGRLAYMKPVELSRLRRDSTELTEPGLQLYAHPCDEPEQDRLPLAARKA